MSKSALDFIYDSAVFIDLYSVLEIEIDAKQDEIKSAYISLAKKNHPDQGGSSDKFQEITRAYEILYSKEMRKEYDLYYLKKNMDEFGGCDILRLRDDYKKWVSSMSKPISKEELDKLYSETFAEYRDKFKEEKINQSDLVDRIKDIEVERKNMEIENSDDSLFNFIKEHNKTTENSNYSDINDVFEYLKYKNSNIFGKNEIMLNDLGTLDTMPGYSSGYTSFIDENEYFSSNLYSSISDMNTDMPKDSIDNLNIDDFNNWKNNKRADSKLSESELTEYLVKRQQEELKLFNDVEYSLADKSKRKEVENYLKTKYLSEDVERYYNGLEDYDKKTNNQTDTSTNFDDILEYMEKIRTEDFGTLNKSNTKLENDDSKSEFMDLKTNRELPKINNVRKREFK